MIKAVVFDVGETLVDETREYGTWADWLGVPTGRQPGNPVPVAIQVTWTNGTTTQVPLLAPATPENEQDQ